LKRALVSERRHDHQNKDQAGMDGLELLRLIAAGLTVVAAVMVAANLSPNTMIAGFAVLSPPRLPG
jgi:Flp pilus assembly protein TadB